MAWFRKHKFGAKPQEVDGIKFPSMAEAEYYLILKHAVLGGGIRELKVHPVFWIEINDIKICRFTPDFEYWEVATERHVVTDVKGVLLNDALLRLKLFAALNPDISVQVVKKRGRYFEVVRVFNT